jgi:acyl-CoA thioester hydrolase
MAAVLEYQVLIREFHLDTFGHVNNAAYLALLEEARWDVVTRRGYGLAEVQRRQQGPVILEVQLKFLKELRLRETIKITTQVDDYHGKIGKFTQKMVKADGTVAAEAVFTFGLFDLKARRLVEPTPEWLRAIGVSE